MAQQLAIYTTILLTISFSGFTQVQDKTKDIEKTITGNNARRWVFQYASPLMSTDEESCSIIFSRQNKSFEFTTPSRDVFFSHMAGKWKVYTSDKIEYYIVLNKDTLSIELGYDSENWKETLVLTQKSKKLENPSFKNIFYSDDKYYFNGRK